jgi:hypothetical protein
MINQLNSRQKPSSILESETCLLIFSPSIYKSSLYRIRRMDEPWVCEGCNIIQNQGTMLYVCDTCGKDYCRDCKSEVMHTKLYCCCGCKKALKRWKQHSAHTNATKHLQCYQKASLRKDTNHDETTCQKECPITSATTPTFETVESHIELMMRNRKGCDHCGYHKEWVKD